MVVRSGADRAETLRGGGGDDTLDGFGGDDRLLGLAGDDLLLAGAGANRVEGGPGRDAVAFGFDALGEVSGPPSRLRADLAAGTYAAAGTATRLAGVEEAFGGPGDDVLAGDGLANGLFGLGGDDRLSGRGGGDLLIGGDGRDVVLGGAGADTLDATGGADELPDELDGGGGDDLLRLGSNDDRARGGVGADQFQAGASVFGGEGGPLFTILDLDRGEGDVIGLRAFADGDAQERYTFVGSRPLAENGRAEVRFEHRGGGTVVEYEVSEGGAATVNAFRLAGRVDLAAGDFLLGFDTTDGDDRVAGTRFGELVLAGGGDDVVSGRDGADDLEGGEGGDRLLGGAGDDRLEGGAGDDALDGGAGDDILTDLAGGEPSDDTYLFSGRFGRDEIIDLGGRDEAVFRGLDRADVALLRDELDLVLTVRGTGDSVRIVSFYEDFVDVDLVFGGGTRLSAEAIA